MGEATVFKWPITGFSTAASRDNPNVIINSGDFALKGTDVKLALQFCPTNNHKDYSHDYSAFYLMLKDLAGKESITLEYWLWLENTRGKKYGYLHKERTFDNVGLGWGRPEFIRHNTLYGAESTFVENDILFLCCKVRDLTPDDDEENVDLTDEDVREKLWELHVKGAIDMCIIRVGDKEFRVAKNILMLQSEVFEKMLLSDFKEGQDNIIVIEDFSADVIEAFIKCLHLQKLKGSEKFAEDLFSLSDKYEVFGLMVKCSEFLCRSLNSKNIFRRLKLAFMHDDEKLKTATLDHVTNHAADGNFRSILKSPEWKRLAYDQPDLADEITEAIFEEAKWLY